MNGKRPTLDDQSPPPRASRLEDIAYVAPMAVFLVLTYVGGKWPAAFTWSYVAKTFLAGSLIVFFWQRYTPVRWNAAWLGVVVGVVGIFQWVGMEKLLLHFWPSYPRPGVDVFDPTARDAAGGLLHFSSVYTLWAFTIVRWAGAAVVVPFMEELFWRDWLWRTIQAPNDFKMVEVGEHEWFPALVVTAAFASVHVQWITALAWGATIAWLLVRTRSLGACIIAHGVTNFLLGAYVQYTHDWYFW